jgi:hypothetical protein
MTEFELVQIIEAAIAQVATLIGQIIAVNFAMIVAIYYFLERAGRILKLAALGLYFLGTFMFLLLAVREANIAAAAVRGLRASRPEQLGPVARVILDLADSSMSAALTVAMNASVWALWIAVVYLLFFWKREAR